MVNVAGALRFDSVERSLSPIIGGLEPRREHESILPKTDLATQLCHNRLRSHIHHPKRWMQRIEPKILIHRYSTPSVKTIPTRRPVLVIKAVIRCILIRTSLWVGARIIQHLGEDTIGVEDERRCIGVCGGQIGGHAGNVGVVSGDVTCFQCLEGGALSYCER